MDPTKLSDEILVDALAHLAFLLPVAEAAMQQGREDSEAAARWIDALGLSVHAELVRRGVICDEREFLH